MGCIVRDKEAVGSENVPDWVAVEEPSHLDSATPSGAPAYLISFAGQRSNTGMPERGKVYCIELYCRDVVYLVFLSLVPTRKLHYTKHCRS